MTAAPGRFDGWTAAALADLRAAKSVNAHRLVIVARPQMPWVGQANCRGMDPNDFFPARGENEKMRAAKAVCAGCPVRVECLEYALATREREGVFGGTGGRERLKIAQARRRAERYRVRKAERQVAS